MSHFTVLVITESADELEQALAPFQENNMGDCPVEYLEFYDMTEEITEEYEELDDTKLEEVYALALPKLTDKHKDNFRKKYHDIMLNQLYVAKDYPRELESLLGKDWMDYVYITQATRKQRFPTFRMFAEDYEGYRFDNDKQAYGYWENPNRKWDWWVLGGRWSGFFKMKPGTEFEVGEPGLFRGEARPGYADQARKGDIDFEGMLADAEREANEKFDEVEKAISGIPGTPRTWAYYRTSVTDIGEARKLYAEDPFIKALKEADLDMWSACAVETYHLHEPDSRQRYINDRRCSAFSTFAVLYEGEWYEKGEMGWFGLVAYEKSKYDWGAQFMDIIDSLSDDAILSVVDCHI